VFPETSKKEDRMTVLQCPECELRFAFASELEQHLRDEHPDFKAEGRGSISEAELSAARRRRQIKHEPHSDR
jgi:hypothetical protein